MNLNIFGIRAILFEASNLLKWVEKLLILINNQKCTVECITSLNIANSSSCLRRVVIAEPLLFQHKMHQWSMNREHEITI